MVNKSSEYERYILLQQNKLNSKYFVYTEQYLKHLLQKVIELIDLIILKQNKNYKHVSINIDYPFEDVTFNELKNMIQRVLNSEQYIFEDYYYVFEKIYSSKYLLHAINCEFDNLLAFPTLFEIKLVFEKVL